MYQNVDIEVYHERTLTRAKSKKELKERLATYGPDSFYLSPVSPMGPQYSGSLINANRETTFILEGPDPYGVHKWYAAIKFKRTNKNKDGAWVIE